jgi:hypothetical protein
MNRASGSRIPHLIGRWFWTCFSFVILFSCSAQALNPPAKGFNAAGSDARAVEIADQVMVAMGGRENWDETRFIVWKFFGRRLHIWDKLTGDLRFEEKDIIVLMNIHSKNGRVWKGGNELAEADSTSKYLKRGYRAWINDSYWLVMPYKLKDTGVTLKYSGEGTMENGRDAHILTLTFENVGVTPQNKYDVYVDKERMLVEEWAFYRKSTDEEPGFKNPWTGWAPHGNILLSAERGKRGHTDVGVYRDLPRSVFESSVPVDLTSFK